MRKIAAFLAHSGDSWLWFAGLGLVWLLSPGAWRTRAETLILSIFCTAVVVTIIKFTIRRPRPPGEWGGIYRLTDPHSFPSGHAARAMLLTLLGWHIGPPWFAIALSAWMPMVSLARIAMGVHYASDVVAGWFVGAMMALVCMAVL